MRARRGLTLVEVLVATMLLAAIAAACLPLLSSATRTAAAAAAPPAAPEPFELARLAAEFMGDGGAAARLAAEGGEQRLEWPDDAPWPAATVTRREFGVPEPDHAWIVFSCQGVTASAWVPVAPPPAPPPDPEGQSP